MTIDGYVLYQQLSHRIWEKQWISSDFPWRNDPILPTMDVMDNYWMTKFVVPTESEINSGLTITCYSVNYETNFLQFLQWKSSAGHQKPAKLVASPLKFSATPASYRSAPPQLGEHTEEVLNRAGFSDTELEELKKNGVLEDEHMGKWWENDGKMMGTYVILENWWSLGFFSSPLMMDSGNLIIEILRDCDGNGWILNGIQGKNSGSGCVREWGIPYNSPKWSFHEDMMNNQME